MANQVFTDAQINEILNIFRQNMGHRQYIGARYVPIFGRVGETSIEWDNTKPYEPLTIVLYQGNSFTSRQYVPAGIDINNTEFWAETGNYNAQVEQYRQEVLEFDERISENETALDNISTWQDNARYINDLNAASRVANDDFSLKGQLNLGENQRVQSIDVYNGFIYVIHHIEDAAMLYCSKYNYDTLEFVARIEIGLGLHGNGAAINKTENALYITSSQNAIIYAIDLETFTLKHRKQYSGVGISGIAFNNAGTKAALNPTGLLRYVIYSAYNLSRNCFVGGFLTDINDTANAYKQDMCATDSFIYQLCSNQGYSDVSGQFISIMGWNGFLFKNMFLPNTENELEGIARLSEDAKLVIVDVIGNVFEVNTDTGILSAHQFSQGIGNQNNGCMTRYTTSDPTIGYSANTDTWKRMPIWFDIPYLTATDAGLTRTFPEILMRFNTRTVFGKITNTGLFRINHTGCLSTQGSFPFNLVLNYGLHEGREYLEQIFLYSFIDNARVAKTFTWNDSEATYATKIEEFWTSVETTLPQFWADLNTFTLNDAVLQMDRLWSGCKVFPYTNINYIPKMNSDSWTDNY